VFKGLVLRGFGGGYMNDEQVVLRLRKKVFHEWRYRGLTWRDVKSEYGFGKTWFYKYKKRFIEHGEAGLKNKAKKRPVMPHALGWQDKLRILDYVYKEPAHGPKRIGWGVGLSTKAVWRYLKDEGLNTRHKRLLWADFQGKPVFTKQQQEYLKSKKRHIESKRPGELICLDTLWLNVKNLGKIWQWTGCDTYSSYGWAKVYPNRYCDHTVDFLENHILKNVPSGKIKRILTDRGTEFCFSRDGSTNYLLQRVCKDHNLRHSVTKPRHPWTNGYVERLNQTIWQEFYLSKLFFCFDSLEQLQDKLDEFMRYYNFTRPHSGYKLQQQGLRYPAHSFFRIKESKKLVRVEI